MSKNDIEASAQELIYDAWETASAKKRIELANKALELWPDCADAYVILGEGEADNLEQALEYYQEGVRAGERALGSDGFEEYAGHFWGFLETRPYMRARARLADTLILLGRKDEGARHFSEMLTLNPGDNQGIRYELAALLLELDRDEELQDLLVQYEEDGSANFSYTRALSAYRGEGDSPGSRRLLTEAQAVNPHVPAYMLGRRKLPRRLPETIGFGDESEAVYYVFTCLPGWARTDGALEWLGKRERELTGGKQAAGGISKKTGRNEPCPCGSGIKYKRCCGGHDAVEQGMKPTDDVMEEIGEFIEGKSFESFEQIQAETDRFMEARNTESVEEFDGLSPDQMTWFLYRAFDPGSPVVFRTDAPIPDDVPFLRLFMPLVRELGQGPLKETVTGNLPRKTVRAVALSYFGDEYLTDKRFMTGLRGENDFQSLHIVRLIAGMGGFIKKKYQRFSLTKRGESVLADGVSSEVFLRLLKTYTGKFNWAYRDGFEDLPIVQMSALFSLYLLQKCGGEDRPQSFYEEKFLNAFPMAVEGVIGNQYWSREDTVKRCFTIRAMDRFAHFFGLMEYAEKESRQLLREDRVVRKTPFLDDLISFRLD